MLDRTANALAVAGFLVLLSGFVSVSGAAEQDQRLEHEQGLEAPPEWVSGETWRVQVTDSYSLQPYEVQVMAGGRNATVLGARLADFQTPVLADRALPLGKITGFSYEVDDTPFNMLDFPLTRGKQWTTNFGSVELVAKVDEVKEGLATVTFTPPAALVPTIRVVYDSVLGFPRSVERHGFASFEVVGHDIGSPCDSVALSKLDVAFNEGQSQTGFLSPAQAPIRSVTVAEDYDGLAITLFAASTPGFQRAIVNAPDGTQYASDPIAAAQGDFHAFYSHQDPAGVWSLERESFGSGFAHASGLAYALEPLDGSCASTTPATAAIAVNAGPASPFGQLLRWLVAGLLELAAMLVRFRRTIRTWLPLILVVPLFARLSHERVIQHPTRLRILKVVKANPGLSTQGIRQRCSLTWAQARYHLELLVSHGVLEDVHWGRNRNWFLADSRDLSTKRKAAALNRPGAKALFEAIRSSPGASPAELARNLDLHHSTVAYYLSWLERADLVRRERVGREARCYLA